MAAGGSNGAAPALDPGMYLDRVTQEDRREDWEMKVMLVVVIDPTRAGGASDASIA